MDWKSTAKREESELRKRRRRGACGSAVLNATLTSQLESFACEQ